MEITTPDIQTVQTSPQESELVLKEGEKINVNFIRKLESGMILLNIRGKTVSAEADFNPTAKSFTAVTVKSPTGGVQLKFFPPLIEFAETAENSSSQTNTASSAKQTTTQATTQSTTQNANQPQQTAQTTGQQTTASSQETIKQENFIGTANLKADPKIILKSPEQQIQTSTQSTGQGQNALKSQLTTAQSTNQQNAYAQTVSVKQAEVVTSSDGKVAMLKLPPGSLNTTDGETVRINILKMMDNGKTLISVKDSVFEVKLDPQVFKTLFAEVQSTSDALNLSLLKLPVENLDQTFVKQQVSGMDVENLMKAFGKFKHVDMGNLSPEKLKDALKDSGISFENKLLKGDSVDGDEKFNALLNSDTSAREGITRMQVTNMMLAGGIFAFLKTQDENVGDTLLRYKKNLNGSDTVYVSTTFTELGDTLLVIRPSKGTVSVTIKTEKDISDLISSISLENTSIHWYKLSKQDMDVMDPKKDIAQDLGAFEVII